METQKNIPKLKMPSPLIGFTDGVQLSVNKIFAQARGEQIVTSLLDTDFYKFPMNQLQKNWIPKEEQDKYWWGETWWETDVTFSWINRHHKEIKPHEVIDINELREQLEAVRKITFTPAELSYLRGMPIDPQMQHRMFSWWFIKSLNGFKLPEFELWNNEDWSFKLNFSWRWDEVTYWEIISMSIISEMYFYWLIKKYWLSNSQVSWIYSWMMYRLEETAKKISQDDRVAFAEFWTRRRHSKYWHWLAYSFLKDRLWNQLSWTSNVKLSMESWSVNPIGTNAHELPMVAANIWDDSDEYILNSQYLVLKKWAEMYPELKVYLPDTFWTIQFHENAPEWLKLEEWVWPRVDSMPEKDAMDFMEKWWREKGIDPVKDWKLIMPSDGLTADRLVQNVRELSSRIMRLPQAMWTMTTNDCKWIASEIPGFRAFSQVCKVTQAGWESAVKLSDNPEKAMGEENRVERFKRIFWVNWMKKNEVLV